MTDSEQNNRWRTHISALISDGKLTSGPAGCRSPEIDQALGVCTDCDHARTDHQGPWEHFECRLCSCGHGADTNTYRRRWCEVNGIKLVGVPGYEVEDNPRLFIGPPEALKRADETYFAQKEAIRETIPQRTSVVGDEHLGPFVYCGQHLRVHATGWCGVSPADKLGIHADSLEQAQLQYQRILIVQGDR